MLLLSFLADVVQKLKGFSTMKIIVYMFLLLILICFVYFLNVVLFLLLNLTNFMMIVPIFHLFFLVRLDKKFEWYFDCNSFGYQLIIFLPNKYIYIYI